MQPRDSLTLIPPKTNLVGLFQSSKKAAISQNIFSFSTTVSADIVNVSRPRIVFLSQLGRNAQKNSLEPAESQ